MRGGAPLAGVSVDVEADNGAHDDRTNDAVGNLVDLLFSGVLQGTDEHGVKSFVGLAPGRQRVRVKTAECHEVIRYIQLKPREAATVEVAVPVAFAIVGHVSDGEAPAAGRKLEITSTDREHPGEVEIKTAAEGTFPAQFRRPGSYSVSLVGTDRTPVTITIVKGITVEVGFEASL